MTFAQLDDESIHKECERYKGLLNRASNHGLLPRLEIHFFYNSQQPNTKMIIDVVAGGALISKILEEAREYLMRYPQIITNGNQQGNHQRRLQACMN